MKKKEHEEKMYTFTGNHEPTKTINLCLSTRDQQQYNIHNTVPSSISAVIWFVNFSTMLKLICKLHFSPKIQTASKKKYT